MCNDDYTDARWRRSKVRRSQSFSSLHLRQNDSLPTICCGHGSADSPAVCCRVSASTYWRVSRRAETGFPSPSTIQEPSTQKSHPGRAFGGAQQLLPPTPDQAPLSAPVLVFPVSKRKHLPAFALKERVSRVPDRLGSAEDHLLAALFTEKDDFPRRTDHGYPLWVIARSRQAHSHTR